MAGPNVNFVQLSGALFAVCLGSAALLATVNSATKPIIDKTAQEKKAASRKGVLPRGTARVDGDGQQFSVSLKDGLARYGEDVAAVFSDAQEASEKLDVFRGYDEKDAVTGYVFSCQLPDGYSGTIDFLIGVQYDEAASEFQVAGSTILTHAETPGLGANIEHVSYTEKKEAKAEGRLPIPGFLKQFMGKTGAEMVLKKDDPKNGTLDALTAATITSKAYAKAVRRVLEFCNRNQSQFLDPVQASAPDADAEEPSTGEAE